MCIGKLLHFFILAQESGQRSLDPGGIAGIVIALLVACASILIIVIIVVVYMMRKNDHQITDNHDAALSSLRSSEGSSPPIGTQNVTPTVTTTGNNDISEHSVQEGSQPSESGRSPGTESPEPPTSTPDNQRNDLTITSAVETQDAGQGAANNSPTTAHGPEK